MFPLTLVSLTSFAIGIINRKKGILEILKIDNFYQMVPKLRVRKKREDGEI